MSELNKRLSYLQNTELKKKSFFDILDLQVAETIECYGIEQGWANFSPRGPHGTSGWSPEGRIKKTKFTR